MLLIINNPTKQKVLIFGKRLSYRKQEKKLIRVRGETNDTDTIATRFKRQIK